jgi:hypothetical protein
LIGLVAERVEIKKDNWQCAGGGKTKKEKVIKVLNPQISKNTKQNMSDFNIRYPRKWKDA